MPVLSAVVKNLFLSPLFSRRLLFAPALLKNILCFVSVLFAQHISAQQFTAETWQPQVSFAAPVAENSAEENAAQQQQLQQPQHLPQKQLQSVAQAFRQLPAPIPKEQSPAQEFVAEEPEIPQLLEQPSIVQPASFNEEKKEEKNESSTESSIIEKNAEKTAKGEILLDQPLSLGNASGKNGQSKDGVEKPKLSAQFAPVVSVIGSLLIVLSAFLCMALLFKKFSRQTGRSLPSEAFENLGKTNLSPKVQLQLLRLGNRLILVSVSSDGVSPVTEITDPDEVVLLLGMCRKLDKNSATALFRKTLTDIVNPESEDDDYFGTVQHNIQNKTAKPAARPKAALQQTARRSSHLDLISEPDEGLANMLANGISGSGVVGKSIPVNGGRYV